MSAPAPSAPHPPSVRPPDLDPRVVGAPGGGRRGSWWAGPVASALELVRLVAAALVIAFLVKTFLLQAFYIPSASMEPTLVEDDRILVEKVTYALRDPRRGEVVVFRNPALPPRGLFEDPVRSFVEGLGLATPRADLDLVKRVVGLPGETVEARGGVVHVDGVALPETYPRADTRTVPPVVVPEGAYWVLGDNRGNSNDSRLGLGFVPREDVVGRAFVVLWPPGHLDVSLGARYPDAVAGDGAAAPG